jgi:hypothetical protein
MMGKPPPPDEFRDAEERAAQAEFCQSIANGFRWTRAEERVGKWLGLLAAIVVWGIAFVIFCQSHPMVPDGCFRGKDGPVPSCNDVSCIPHEPLKASHDNDNTR